MAFKSSRLQQLDEKLQCPIDDDAEYRNTFWCNRDLIPIPESRRTWSWKGYAGYWTITGYVRNKTNSFQNISHKNANWPSLKSVNTTAWTAASSLLALGLSTAQAIGVIVGVALITGVLAVFAGWPGSHHYVGFTVLSRS